MMYLRDISGMINEHVSNTKDKYGDPYLNFIMLTSTLTSNQAYLLHCSKNEAFKIDTDLENNDIHHGYGARFQRYK